MIGAEHGGGTQTADLAVRVAALLARQHDLLARLDEMSQRQMALIEADEADRLLELLGDRQHVVERLQEAGEMLEPLRPAWCESVNRLPAGQRESVRRQIDAIAMLIDRVSARDAEAQRLLRVRRDQIASELLNVDRGRGAVAAYGGRAHGGGPMFQDQEA